MGWLERMGLRKAANTPAEAQELAVATAAATEQMTGAAFDPGVPVSPFAGVGGQAKVWNMQAGYNIKARPERDQRMSFEMLKALTDSYDVAAMCITHRINSIRSLPWNIVPMDGLDSNVELAVQIAERHMRKPDGVRSFRTWLAMYLEDMLRYDAGTLFKRRDRLGRPIGLEVVSGTTIAPVLDKYGRRPTGDAPAFVQYVNGTVWKWFTADDLIYEPFRPQADSPYGIAPLESVLLAANTDLRFQQHFLNYFTEGNIPEGFIILPEEASQAAQMREFQEVFDSYMYGDMAAKRQLKTLPGGSKLEWSKAGEFNNDFAEFLMRKVCAVYHVTPQDIGFTMDVNRATGETQADIQFRTGDLPVINHVQDILTEYLQVDLGLPVKFQFDAGKETEDRVATAQADKIHIELGVVSIDEIRELRYGLATDAERRVPRFINNTTNGPILLRTLLDKAGATDEETAAPAEGVPLDYASGDVPAVEAHKFPGEAGYKQEPNIPDGSTPPAITAPAASQVVPGHIVATDSSQVPSPAGVTTKSLEDTAEPAGPGMGGAVVKATDTGRVLMIQRTLDPEDPAAGRWEFPGGHVEPGEDAEEAARREWCEETGLVWPEDAALVASWDTPDGVYRGHVYRVAQEASVPINTGDGEDGETLAWFDPAHLEGFPALREELARDLPAEALAKGIELELTRWQSNTLTRLKRGQAPRRYRDPVHLPAAVVDAVWAELRKAKDPGNAQSIFDAAMEAALDPKAPRPPKWRAAPPKATPVHDVDLQLTDHYAPQIRDALAAYLPDDAVKAILEHHAEAPLVNAYTTAFWQGADPAELNRVLDEVMRDAYGAGSLAANVQLGQPAEGWDTWKPGAPPNAQPADLSWDEALAEKGVSLRGITATVHERIGSIVEAGVANGDTIDMMAKAINGFLRDPGRAEMIAHTESARTLSIASASQYRAAGVQWWDWVVSAGACPTCLDKEAQNPHPMSDRDLPPGHPRCRCAMAPVAPADLPS